MTVRKRVLTSGRVQGVFFRDSVRQEAERRGVAGSAENLPDGTVEVVLEGAAEDVEAVIGAIRGNPGSSQVSGVEISDGEPQGTQGFSVR